MTVPEVNLDKIREQLGPDGYDLLKECYAEWTEEDIESVRSPERREIIREFKRLIKS